MNELCKGCNMYEKYKRIANSPCVDYLIKGTACPCMTCLVKMMCLECCEAFLKRKWPNYKSARGNNND